MYTKQKWYRLDSAAKIYASLTSARVTTVYRISTTLTEEVDPILLQKSLETIMPRFPYYQVFLKKGLFWYYFEKTTKLPTIEEEKDYPCMNFDIRKRRVFPFRVLYYQNKISFECSHSLTDGTGGLLFISTLLCTYLKEQNKIPRDFSHPSIPSLLEVPKEEEFQVSFSKCFHPNIKSTPSKEKAYHLPFPLSEKGTYQVITGILEQDKLYQLSKQHHASVTEFLCAVYFDALQQLALQKKSRKKPIVLNVPINLRKIFPSMTMRNFFFSLTPTIDPRVGIYSLEEIINYVHHYMQLYTDEKQLIKQISKNIHRERNLALRIIPLFIKNLILPQVYNFWAEATYTSSLSNMGIITLPEVISKHIQRFEIIPPPSVGNKIKAVVTSYQNQTFITFGKLTSNTELEQIFFSKLKQMGLHIKIESNL